ncbi:hypothetical protein J7K86_02230 [bacterium]|nr:hypothetical protein [bacterium]
MSFEQFPTKKDAERIPNETERKVEGERFDRMSALAKNISNRLIKIKELLSTEENVAEVREEARKMLGELIEDIELLRKGTARILEHSYGGGSGVWGLPENPEKS